MNISAQYLTNVLKEIMYVHGGDSMSNQKEENFKRLAENRTNKIIDMLHLLGNLSNTSNYSYSEEQVKTIFSAIEQELEIQRNTFVTKQATKKKFRL